MSDLIESAPPGLPLRALDTARKATQSVSDQLRRNAVALQSDLLRREVEKKTRTSLDVMEEKAMRDTATLAAAAGTPEQAKAMLRKARGKLMNAAANGAETSALEALVRDMARLTKTASENQDREKAAERTRQRSDGTT